MDNIVSIEAKQATAIVSQQSIYGGYRVCVSPVKSINDGIKARKTKT
jgi:hypothetical protein